MADPLVAFDDLEMFLTGWFRSALAARPEPECAGVVVDRVEPAPGEPMPEKLVVIRDDGTSDTDILTGDASIGISVLAGSKRNPLVAKRLARVVFSLIRQIPSGDPLNPVAAVTGRNGPYMVPEDAPRARVYMTATLAVVARAL